MKNTKSKKKFYDSKEIGNTDRILNYDGITNKLIEKYKPRQIYNIDSISCKKEQKRSA